MEGWGAKQAPDRNGEIEMINRWWTAPVVAAAVGLLAACGSTSSPTSSSSGSGGSGSGSNSGSTAGTTAGSSSASGIKTASTSKGTVLVNSQGRTLYWFAIDTPTSSKCSGTCATFWPPVLGKPSMASGASLSGTFGTIKRSGGQLQATYDGHPLYTVQAGHLVGPGQRQRHQHLGRPVVGDDSVRRQAGGQR